MTASSAQPASAGIVGAGTMGTGIAMAFANAGIPVMLVDASADVLRRALLGIAKTYANAADKGRLTDAERETRTNLIATSESLADVAACDIVIEAVFENLDIKRDVFKDLGTIARPDAILATNTSYLDVDAILSAGARPERGLGMHFFSPAQVMKLVEIVRGKTTSADTIATVRALAARLGKVSVVVGNCDGFVGNRMLLRYKREAELLLEEGSTPHIVDESLQAFGFAMGPFAVSDLAGIDIGWRAKQERNARGGLPFRQSRVPDALYDAGRLGQKSGLGYYRYEAGSRTPIPDYDVDKIIAAERRSLGLGMRAISSEEIVERCLLALINEGARILGEGIAESAADIDTVWVNGYGFPASRGGPMTYADELGARFVLERITHYAQLDPIFWKPARLIRERALSGTPFHG